jgi:hypothetical protein
MTERERMITRADAMLKRVAKAREDYAGPCSSCRWSRIDGSGGRCANPIVQAGALEKPNRYFAKHIQECGEQRDARSPYGEIFCGPNGHLYEPGLWSRLFN